MKTATLKAFNLPKSAPKWICTLAPSVPAVAQRMSKPTSRQRYGSCCPHILEDIHGGQFVVAFHNHHEYLYPFDTAIAEIIGQLRDPNEYQLAPRRCAPGPEWLLVQELRTYQVIQPLRAALAVAHTQGFAGSFEGYDKIILSLASRASDNISPEHNKIFERYEKCRNLALRASEPNEKQTAALRAYEQARKLINQLVETQAPLDTPPWLTDWTLTTYVDCHHCKCGSCRIYAHPNGRIWCLDCIKGEYELSHMIGIYYQMK